MRQARLGTQISRLGRMNISMDFVIALAIFLLVSYFYIYPTLPRFFFYAGMLETNH